jgi:hypothetical protein
VYDSLYINFTTYVNYFRNYIKLKMEVAILAAAKSGLIASGIALGTNLASSAVISLIGFTTAGVVAGSTAAGIQAGIGIVAAGSTFGVFQSLGALGLGILGASALPIVAGTGAVVGTTVAIVKLFA